jgi:histidinol-phosphate aminotransferase
MNPTIKQLVRPEIRAINAYHVPDAKGLIKLDAMENPYTWPQALKEGWLKELAAIDVNRYPHPEAPALKERLRQSMSLADDARLLLGNGSDELIQMLAMTVGGPGRTILSVEPGFVMYRMISLFTNSDYVGVPLRREDFGLDMEALLEAIADHQPSLIFLAYPNNPTGNLFDEDEIRRIIEAAPGIVVVDEAYAPFTDASFIPRIREYPNLLVMRTVSKMGLAGLRLGMLMGSGEWLEQIDKTRLPYNINVLTQASAEFALRNQSVLDEQTRAIRQSREEMFQQLAAMEGITAYPSQANFILLRFAEGQASAIHAALREQGILVKNLHGSHPALEECLRITIGTEEENRLFLQGLDAARM